MLARGVSEVCVREVSVRSKCVGAEQAFIRSGRCLDKTRQGASGTVS